jgi:DNA-binding PucR family transcriptional regulator
VPPAPVATPSRRRRSQRSPNGDLAGFLRERPAGTPPGVVGIGPPRTVARLGESFRLATRALVTADAFGLTGTFDITQLGLRPAVVADADVGDALHRRFIEPLEATRSASELVASLRAYFDSGQHIERAAESLFVHPNTLRYRLGRFEELTGASLRDPVVAFEVWWALELLSARG